MYTSDLFYALPELFLVLVIITLLMFGVFQNNQAKEQEIKTAKTTSWLAALSIFLAIFMVLSFEGERYLTFQDMFINDNFSMFLKVLVLFGAMTTLIIGQGFLERNSMFQFEYPILIIFACIGMMMMLSANDLIPMYLGLEMQSLSLYILAAFRRDDNRSVEAGLKYFVLGAIASGMILYGCSLVYGISGSTNFSDIAKNLNPGSDSPANIVGILGIVFILAGLSFKISAVPFHMWTPDVYEGAATPVTAFFSIAPKIAAFGILIRIMFVPFGNAVHEWQQIIIFISIASMSLGALGALNQKKIKRLMAYSSISHVGYALIGVAVANRIGVQSALIYLTIYLIMNLGAFACILSMKTQDQMLEKISDLAGKGKNHPLLASAFAIFFFSLAGIPPLAGFAGKFVIFKVAIDAELYLLSIIGVLTSVISAFYYLRIIKILYFDPGDEKFDQPIENGIKVITGASAILTLLFLLFPNLIFSSANIAANSLFLGM